MLENPKVLAGIRTKETKGEKKKKATDEEICNYVGRNYPSHAWLFALLKKIPNKVIQMIVDDCQV